MILNNEISQVANGKCRAGGLMGEKGTRHLEGRLCAGVKKAFLILCLYALTFNAYGQECIINEFDRLQAIIRSELLEQKENEILKTSFLQEFYIRNVVYISNDSLHITIPFNLHSFDCGAPDCYSNDVSFSFKFGDALIFPEYLPYKEHEHGCIPEETKESGVFKLMEQTEKNVIYYSEEHKKALFLTRNKLVGTYAFYFAEIEQENANSKYVYELLDVDDDGYFDVNFLNDNFSIFRSTVLTTLEYERFIK